MLTVATANVNGIRAASRRGIADWIDERKPDVLCMQEVRASSELLTEHLPGWHLAEQACEIKGRAGVAVATHEPVEAVRIGMGLAEPAHTGRWVETDLAVGQGLTVASVYVHSGAVDTVRQEQKYEFLAAMTERMQELMASGKDVLVCGDFNIAHRNVDIKNWKGNLKNSGFLPEERAYLDQWFDQIGWVDLGRRLGGEGPGPYTWWSWRGKAFDNDAGWRIDYQLATPSLAAKARRAWVDRAPAYDQRWSDHAPLVIDYDIDV